MTATNNTGYEIQIYADRRIGWMMESNGYKSLESAKAALKAIPKDQYLRRAYELLAGY
jgi:hypothetical protein